MRQILYLGLDPSRYEYVGELTHFPIIQTVPLLLEDVDVRDVTHLLFTSPTAVSYWPFSFDEKVLIAIGGGTAAKLNRPCLVAPHATQEGVVELLKSMDLSDAFILWPRSTRSRVCLERYFEEKKVKARIVDLYETKTLPQSQLPNLSMFDEIVFTSPSTVDAFFSLFNLIPGEIKLTPIGPVTAEKLASMRLLFLQ